MTDNETPRGFTKFALSNKSFILPVVLFCAFLAGLGLFIWGILGMFPSDKQYITLPDDGTNRVVADEARVYDIYYEYRYYFQLNREITFTFTDLESGQTARSRPAALNSNYSVNDISGRLVAQVALEPGFYTVTADYPKDGPALSFAFTRGMQLGRFAGGMVAFFIGVFCLVGGILLLVFISVARGRVRRGSAPPPWPDGSAGAGGYAPPPPPPPAPKDPPYRGPEL